MLAEIGYFSLLLVALFSLAAVGLSAVQTVQKETESISMQLSVAHLCTGFSLLSILALAAAFVSDDFTLSYVSSHSNSELPDFFKAAAVWGGHEGSLLFWVVMLSCWASAIALLHRRLHVAFMHTALLIALFILSAFAFFTLFASNPFEINSVIPEQGRDLNPMLQDVGLIFHPPLLYVGYVGFASSFALAFAALWHNEHSAGWLVYARRFALFAWAFLSGGIILGAWWAYNELGWGGWWFWDPVENASLLPWLTATALLHSLIAGIQHNTLQRWVLSLSFATFTLSILGTFVVRSGILTSVHAFAVDPTRGIVLLLMLFALVVAGFGSFIIRAAKIKSEPIRSLQSRGFLFMLANIVFVVAMLTVILGTFYPMLFQMFGLGNISVGAPYFNTLFAPLTFVALLLMAIAPWLRWRADNNSAHLWRFLFKLALWSLFIGISLYWLQEQQMSVMPMLTWVLACFVLLGLGIQLAKAVPAGYGLKMMPMLFAHLGIAVMSVGAAMNAYHSVEDSARMAEGDKAQFSHFQVSFDRLELYVGPNYTAERAHLAINGNILVVPERRHYQVRVMNMTEPGIKTFWHGDLYITLGEKLADGSFALRLQYKAYVIWLWAGGMLCVLGGLSGLLVGRRVTIRQSGKNSVVGSYVGTEK